MPEIAEQVKLALLFPNAQIAPEQTIAPMQAAQPAAVAEKPVPKAVDNVDQASDVEGDTDEQLERQQAVRGVIQQLRQLIVLIAHNIWQMKLTEEQVSSLADRMIYQIADEINEITVERVKDIANDLLLGVEEKTPSYRRKRKT